MFKIKKMRCQPGLSGSRENIVKWGWLSIVFGMLVIGIVMIVVGNIQSHQSLYIGGIFVIIVTIANFIMWTMYQCNLCGWQEKCRCCKQSQYNEI